MDFGKYLKEKRKEQKLTQSEVAHKLFVSRQTISNWENNKTLPDIDNMIEITEFYRISLDELLLKGSEVTKNGRSSKLKK